jgi:N-acetylglucosaminyltransferase
MADQLVVAALRAVFLLYVTLVLLHSSLERVYALRSRRQRRVRPAAGAEPARWPAVDVVIPCFNEDPALLEACCRSVAGQDYPGPLDVWLVDDGSGNRAALLGVYERWADRGWSVRLLDRNTGKRAAQDEAVRRGRGELVVLMDSDTVLAPVAVYRRSLLAELWPRYLTQTFAGVPCTNGDDLHLTNLVLATGRQVLFEPLAVASTWVPRSLGLYLRQQLRWNRSFYRELRWTFAGIRSRHPYLALDVLARALLPLLLAAALVLLASEGLLVGWGLLAADLTLALAMLLVTAAFLLAHGASVPFLLLYGPLHMALLVPVRVWALLTLADPCWETR